MTINLITVRKFAYLKSPKFAGTVHNSEGGSSNIPEQPSLKRIAGWLYAHQRELCLARPGLRVAVETWHGFDKDENPVFTTELTDVDALLSRTGISRNL